MRSFPNRQACIDHYNEQFPTLPPYLIELALDFDLAHPNADPAKHVDALNDEAKALAKKLQDEHVQYKKDDVIENGVIYDSPADVPDEPLAEGLQPGEQYDSDTSDSDEENVPRLQYHPRDKTIFGSDTSDSSDEDTAEDSDDSTTKLYNDTLYSSSSDEEECATANDPPSTTD